MLMRRESILKGRVKDAAIQGMCLQPALETVLLLWRAGHRPGGRRFNSSFMTQMLRPLGKLAGGKLVDEPDDRGGAVAKDLRGPLVGMERPVQNVAQGRRLVAASHQE